MGTGLSVKYSYALHATSSALEAPGVRHQGLAVLSTISGNVPVAPMASRIVAHAGWQFVKNWENISTTLNKDNVWDYKLGGTWDIMGSGWVVGAFWVGTSEKDFFLTAENPPSGAGKSGFLATVSKTF